ADRIDYDAWGRVISDTSPGFLTLGYAGGICDQDTKLVRFGERDYDASAGRWTAKDPLNMEGNDANLFGYVGDDPQRYTDNAGTYRRPTPDDCDEKREQLAEKEADRIDRRAQLDPNTPTFAGHQRRLRQLDDEIEELKKYIQEHCEKRGKKLLPTVVAAAMLIVTQCIVDPPIAHLPPPVSPQRPAPLVPPGLGPSGMPVPLPFPVP
ncbi:MAG TPA: RHS repeat-associated core domain-containing protein, partial [Candidatus Udaeobacter sp.]|nr:RHS repeat-associated core domain-containing protein [Candidatus Udaeobacter sp.]